MLPPTERCQRDRISIFHNDSIAVELDAGANWSTCKLDIWLISDALIKRLYIDLQNN